MLVGELIEKKGTVEFHTIPAGASVEDAVKTMIKKRITAFIVMEDDHPVGIFTERDVLRFHVKYEQTPFTEIKVSDAMTNKLIAAEPKDEVSSTLAMMVQVDIKHLPVIKGKEIIGLLTIRDLVREHIGNLTAELHNLKDYVAALEEAGRD